MLKPTWTRSYQTCVTYTFPYISNLIFKNNLFYKCKIQQLMLKSQYTCFWLASLYLSLPNSTSSFWKLGYLLPFTSPTHSELQPSCLMPALSSDGHLVSDCFPRRDLLSPLPVYLLLFIISSAQSRSFPSDPHMLPSIHSLQEIFLSKPSHGPFCFSAQSCISPCPKEAPLSSWLNDFQNASGVGRAVICFRSSGHLPVLGSTLLVS